jgi:hypothetical protein
MGFPAACDRRGEKAGDPGRSARAFPKFRAIKHGYRGSVSHRLLIGEIPLMGFGSLESRMDKYVFQRWLLNI